MKSVVDFVVINVRRCYQTLIVWHFWTNIIGPGGWDSTLVWGVGMIDKSDHICRRTYMKSAVDFVVINVRRCHPTLISMRVATIVRLSNLWKILIMNPEKSVRGGMRCS
jgi:hypothetical protein